MISKFENLVRMTNSLASIPQIYCNLIFTGLRDMFNFLDYALFGDQSILTLSKKQLKTSLK